MSKNEKNRIMGIIRALFPCFNIAPKSGIKELSKLSIGGIPLPMDVLAKNILIAGASDTKADLVILSLVQQARNSNQRMVIHVKGDEILKQFRTGIDLMVHFKELPESLATDWRYAAIGNTSSIFRDFFNRNDDSCLFIVGTPEKQFESNLLEYCMAEAMCISTDMRMIFVFNGLETLPRLTTLVPFLVHGRKLGICSIVGISDMSKIKEVYGEEETPEIIAYLQNKLVMNTQNTGILRIGVGSPAIEVQL